MAAFFLTQPESLFRLTDEFIVPTFLVNGSAFSHFYVFYFVILSGSLVSHTWQARLLLPLSHLRTSLSLWSCGGPEAELAPPASLGSIGLQEARAVFPCEGQPPALLPQPSAGVPGLLRQATVSL